MQIECAIAILKKTRILFVMGITLNYLGLSVKEVNKLINKKRQHDESGSLDAEALHLHYAAISHDPQYQTPAKKCTVTKNNSLVTEALMFKMLDSLHHTAEGADGIPAWLLRLAAPALAGPLAHLVNLSLITATVPKQWKTAVIRPVHQKPKVSQPKVPADYRPISIVPVLARMVERLVVQTYVYPAFQMEEMKHLLSDQYAFRPTGSTTAAVITIMQKVADLLESNKYVTIIALDFSKAFDTVRHHELAKKLAKLAIPDNICNWLIDNLLDRKHATKFYGLISKIAEINASIVQGLGVGSSEFDVCASDLHPHHKENLYVKFADATYLLVGSNMRHTVCEEFDGVKKWAELNNLKLNTDKPKQMLVPKSGRWTVPEPPPLGMERVYELKILGVLFTNDLSVTSHVDDIISKCASSTYALRILRANGLQDNALFTAAVPKLLGLWTPFAVKYFSRTPLRPGQSILKIFRPIL